MSDIEPKIPFTVLETTLTGLCQHCLMSQRAALWGCSLAAGPAVAPCPAHGLALWPMAVLLFLQPSPSGQTRLWIRRAIASEGQHGTASRPSQGWQELLMAAPCCRHTSTLPCSHRSLWEALEQSPHFPKAYPGCRTPGSWCSEPSLLQSLPVFYRILCTGAMGEKIQKLLSFLITSVQAFPCFARGFPMD